MSNFTLNLRTGFLISNYLLAGLALCCLTLSEIFSGLTGGILIAGLIYCYVLEYRSTIPVSPSYKIPESTWGFLLITLLYFGFDLPVINLISWFLVYLLYTRFIYKTEFNDYLFGYLIAIICLLIGALYVQGLAFGGVFFGFYLVLSWCLIFYHLMSEQAGGRSQPKSFRNQGKNQKLKKAFVGWSTGVVLLSFLLTAAIFISFPRLGLGFMALNNSSQPITGFSDVVTLGDVGKIKQNSSVVMRVEYTRNGKPYRPNSRILWRGVVLDHYNGKTWNSTLSNEFSLPNKPGRGLGLFKISQPREVVEQTVYLESFEVPYLFTHGVPLFVDGNFKNLKMNQGFVLKTDRSRSGPDKYTLVSEISNPNTTYNLKVPGSDKNIFPDRFLQLPQTSEATISLANELTQSADSIEEKAFNILNHFKDFKYSLDMQNDPDKTALEYFLFDRKEGHCEYFASAMTILLRQSGIPARLVNGFTGVEWHEWGNYLIIRQSHAHSWVEAFIPQKGWVVYDPTPPDPNLVVTSTPSPFAKTMDLLRMNWQRYIIRYSYKDQENMVQFFRSGSRDMLESIKNLPSMNLSDAQRWVESQKWLLLFLIAAIAIYSLLRQHRQSPALPDAVKFYKDLQKQLEREGIKISPSLTARELLKSSIPATRIKQVELIIDYYEKVRFGNRPANPQIEKEIKASLYSA
ncbi:MAG: DUF3488 and transglutaminase-like domain-containing protein [Nitrospinota bacterium]